MANRVEIAIRIAKTCKKSGIRPCRIYSEADKESVHMRYCDEAINIGGSLPLESLSCRRQRSSERPTDSIVI